jgi:hypothetical protein
MLSADGFSFKPLNAPWMSVAQPLRSEIPGGSRRPISANVCAGLGALSSGPSTVVQAASARTIATLTATAAVAAATRDALRCCR